MNAVEVVRKALDEYLTGLIKALAGLTPEERRWHSTPESTHVDFIVWHMARSEDTTIQECRHTTSDLWTSSGWADQLGIQQAGDGCGMSPEEVHSFPPFDVADLLAYFDAVRSQTVAFLMSQHEELLELPFAGARPGQSVGGLLAHLLIEEAQHLGQVAYIRGLLRGLEHTTSSNNPDTP